MTGDSVITQLSDAVTELLVMLPSLESRISQQRSRRPGEGCRITPGSRPPWDAQAAAIILDVHHGSRDLESGMRAAVTGTLRVRGGGTANTVAALSNLPPLAAGAPDPWPGDALRQVRSWSARGKIALGEAEPLIRLPVEPGRPEPRCPYCEKMTLRSRPVRGEVRCINPACLDADGNKPVAVMTYGRYSCDWSLVWADGRAFQP